jgi:MtN3 and saliva related transmembrane protein
MLSALLGSNVEMIGFWAAVLTTAAFAPQVVRTWQTGGHQLSWAMLALFGAGVSLWFVYGVLRASGPIMLANGLTGLQVVMIVSIKLRAAATADRRRAAGEGKRRAADHGDRGSAAGVLP